MKPDWKDAPEWAQWLAQDEGGDWYWYGPEPYPTDSGYWLANRVESAAQLHDDWRETLEQRPTERSQQDLAADGLCPETKVA